jgi:hypothetical protein
MGQGRERDLPRPAAASMKSPGSGRASPAQAAITGNKAASCAAFRSSSARSRAAGSTT